ncbi:MAG TPA: hypothetical protein PK668_21970 [Myxococcota bacterium]|nr:hypothetical protein [Myxococcota bacterium]HRY96357.1 hypothetical protein [Myxococcota bacterium]HSA20790.1 hypothetical protein [Myxococcota bacterium]
MPWDEQLLSLRPTNAMHPLGAGSRVPLFNGRHLLDALADGLTSLWLPRVEAPAAVAGLLRAAAHARAALGLCLGSDAQAATDWRHQARPGALLQAVLDGLADLDDPPPLCLHVEAPPVEGAGSPQADSVQAHLAACLGAGFTSFGVDLGACPEPERPALAARLLEPALDLELGWSARLPAEGGTREARVEHVVRQHQALRAAGLSPDLVLLPGPDELGDEAWYLAAGVTERLAPCGVAWRSAGRKLKAPPAQVGVRALLGDVRLARTGLADPDKLEALAYLDGLEYLEALGARGSSQRVADFLGRQH